jgi:uncharacterized damage-inducible protein DinB
MLSEGISARLRDQLSGFEESFLPASAEVWGRKPASGKWSARENLAHLARYHEISLERLRRILKEERPQFARYRAEDDLAWPRWSSLETNMLRARIRALRAELISAVGRLSGDQLAKTGIHPALGEMNVPQWLEFFLLHEAHHLYAILLRLRDPE